MGWDIHGIFQHYNKKRKMWVDVESAYEQDRDYSLFRVLSGVGYEPPLIAEPRGLPEDFILVEGEFHPIENPKCVPARFRDIDSTMLWMGDLSRSWLNGEELLKWYSTTTSEDREDMAYFFDEVARLVKRYGAIRFVFGFTS